MPSKLWKNLDDYADSPDVVASRSDEFDGDVDAALTALRREYGIDDNGDHRPLELSAASTDDSRQDLRDLLPSVSRRGFLKLTGAAAVFGLAGCWHNPPETLVPYQTQPEGSTLGKARFYSTAIRIDGQAVPVMAKLYDHRPIKLEGNPDDPFGKGKLTTRGQAALLDLYDPDRLQKGPLSEGKATDWATLDAAVGNSLKQGDVGLIAGSIDGPANARLLADLQSGLGGRLKVAVYQAYADDVGRGARAAVIGSDADAVYSFEQADAIVTLGSCPIGGGTGGLYEQVGIGANRRLSKSGKDARMGTLVAFEPTVSQVGSVADVRQRVTFEDLGVVAWGLAYKVAELTNTLASLPGGVTQKTYADALAIVGQNPGLIQKDKDGNVSVRNKAEGDNAIDFAAARLVAAGQRSVVYVGGAVHNDQNSAGFHQAAAFMNTALGAIGTTVSFAQRTTAVPASLSDTRALLKAAAKGEVKTLILWNANPAYSYPGAAEDLKQATAKGARIIALADRIDETAALATDVAPLAHDLESWGDGEPRPGVFALQQAVVQRLWNNRSGAQSLMAFAAAAGVEAFQQEAKETEVIKSVVSQEETWQAVTAGVVEWRDYVRETWQTSVHAAADTASAPRGFWTAALSRGFVITPAAAGAVKAFDGSQVAAPAAGATSGMKLVLSASRNLGDGSQANNAWLQETPDPIGKVTWDNYLAVSLKDAKALDFGKNDVATLSVGAETVTVPVLVQPGQAEGVVELFLGWGRQAGEVSADGGLGQAINAFSLGAGQRWGIDCSVEKADESYVLATTQYHHYMDGRDIVLDESIDAHRADPDGKIRESHHHHLWSNGSGAVNEPLNDDHKHNISMWGQTHAYPGRRWGMLIDLNACNGCGSCIVACSAENNVPVVGREEVRRGREMHWMRIDRYYSTPATEYFDKTEGRDDAPDDHDLQMFHQPMMCQHCGHAPCEEVCPAMATMHNDEAVNVMVYNRCIGTRFCANNCPYKVRRFNFYEYTKYRKGPDTGDPLDRVVKNLTTEGSTSSQQEMGKGGWTAPLAMMLNPTVTVRSKGVMEKCNFCIQRTKEIREVEKRSNSSYDDTDATLTTACAQTCPAEAITFGDINDPYSTVSQKSDANPHSYEVLDKFINTRPTVSYLKKVRNAPGTQEELKKTKKGGHGDHPASKDGDAHGATDEHARRTVRDLTEGMA